MGKKEGNYKTMEIEIETENKKELDDRIAIIRAYTRALGLLIPLIAVCVGIFIVSDIRDTLTGGVIGVLGTAGIFYYEGKI